MPGPLTGIRVLDLADQKGVYCCKILADMGADVIKIEPPGGDPMRHIGPFLDGDRNPEKSLYWFHMNTNKRSVTLDLNTRDGIELLKRLAAGADVMVETFGPGELARMGVAWEVLEEINPGLILASITPFGQTGPWSRYQTCDLVGLALGGLMSLCGWPDGPPERVAGSQAYHQCSLQAALSINIALYHRLATGRGVHIDISMHKSIPITMLVAMPNYVLTGEVRRREGDGHTQAAYGTFPCKDGYVDFRLFAADWENLVAWLDSDGAAGDLKETKWQDPFFRRRRDAAAHIDSIVRPFLLKHTMKEIYEAGQNRGLQVGAVNTARDVSEDPQLLARNFFIDVDHPELGRKLKYLGPPFRMSQTPWDIRRRAPLIGEDNVAVLENDLRSPRHTVDRVARGGGDPANGTHPFKGLRVLEFGVNAAGPLVGKLLADFGAEVVTVENREHIRYRGGGRQPSANSKNLTSMNLGVFANKFNFNKLSLTLNIKRPEGLAIARKLASISDILIDSFRPDVLEKWGMTYDELKKLNPGIIMIRMPTMGGGGPYKFFRSTSWILMGLSGLNWASGNPERMPVCPTANSLPDAHCNPLHAASAVVSALYHRAETGQGQFIELSQFESTVCVTETAVFQYLANRQLPARMGNRLDYAAPHGVYRCQGEDRWCAIAVFSETQWQALCDAIGNSRLARDKRYRDMAARQTNAESLDRLIESWTRDRPPLEVMDSLQKAGVPAGMVQNVEDLLIRDPQLRHSGHWVTVAHPEAGKLVGEGWGFNFIDGPQPAFNRPPLLGEQNDYVLGQILKMPEEEINQLLVDGIID